MKRQTLSSLVASAVLLASPVAMAGVSVSVPAFEAQVATARTAASPGGTSITRAEMTAALSAFQSDDHVVDAAEHTYLGTKLADSVWKTGINGPAIKYLGDFYELYDAGPVAPQGVTLVTTSTATLYGSSGPLAGASRIAEGYIPNGQGVANNETLKDAYFAVAYPRAHEQSDDFYPITLADLVTTLRGQVLFQQMPTADDVDGAVAYITQISRNSNRLYISSFVSELDGGWAAGYVIAAVSTDRRYIRFVRVTTASD
ncbi:hypothetical protein DRW03_12185 [Corallococcus sp. H22C18031201]|uniref:hypothetical protein n=1 Tax=Citreicoccus inhibens TaxID=2849499 RepID=UPI000E728E1B|nr:hypothetical protein [Citreicoccus inhibens]MBU8894221.1 hypothetical protein [Citreicoccus inhibens]RJS23083.1 hypothetical protein DRW03_12185 [Corallococcus sp. H22C18031201]